MATFVSVYILKTNNLQTVDMFWVNCYLYQFCKESYFLLIQIYYDIVKPNLFTFIWKVTNRSKVINSIYRSPLVYFDISIAFMDKVTPSSTAELFSCKEFVYHIKSVYLIMFRWPHYFINFIKFLKQSYLLTL